MSVLLLSLAQQIHQSYFIAHICFLIDVSRTPQKRQGLHTGCAENAKSGHTCGDKKQKEYSKVQLATEFVLICCKNRSAIGVKV